ncbi:serine hydrolase domain-containing protein [Cryobacterium sp. TmT2-59]|uniref:serine hydrolase domain-containing protein n=1 Tax=Cryobacterium sp. TmT2-59 TaxID=1259264 RepID=UPI00141B8CD1|nr:serine hydrolase domain-containing protein [Cryobacterium sp. TmT2-59]
MSRLDELSESVFPAGIAMEEDLVKSGANRRHRLVRALTGRDTDSFARGWLGKVLVGIILLVAPVVMLFASLRRGTYADDGWRAVLVLAVLAVVYFVSRRVLLTVLVAGLVVGLTSWAMVPAVATAHHGDRTVLSRLDIERGTGRLDGFHDVSVALVDLGATQSARFGGLGSDMATPMEVGSLTKAMTGLVIADSVQRGELRMGVPISTYLPELEGSLAGTVTMNELVTHTAGYAEFGAETLRRAVWNAPFGRNFFDTDMTQMIQEAREGTLTTRGHYAYSTLGAAVAGQAVAAAAGMSYSKLMRTRLFTPLGMIHTAIEDEHSLVSKGRSKSGLPVEPWVLRAYAPGGGAVSTAGDLAKLATALLDGTAPGMTALNPTTPTSQPDTHVGGFWYTTTQTSSRTVTWHSGETGGYSTYFGLDRANHRAAIVLSDVANRATDELGRELLTNRN